MNVTVLSFAFNLSACASVEVKDTVWYGDMGPAGAYEFHTHNDKTKEFTLEEWDRMRPGMICTQPKTFAEWKAIILKLCTENPRCKFEEVESFLAQIESRLP